VPVQLLVPDHEDAALPELAWQAQFKELTSAEGLHGQPKFIAPLSPEEAMMVTPIAASFIASVLKLLISVMEFS
jgi:hypothetical protein